MTPAGQYQLIHESLNEAMADAVRAVGGSKKVGSLLWPALPIEQAKNRLNDCLNAARPEKLSLAEVMFVLRAAHDAGYHGAMQYIAQESGYSLPQPVEPQDEAAQLQREFIEAVRASQKIAARLERLNVPTVKAVA